METSSRGRRKKERDKEEDKLPLIVATSFCMQSQRAAHVTCPDLSVEDKTQFTRKRLKSVDDQGTREKTDILGQRMKFTWIGVEMD